MGSDQEDFEDTDSLTKQASSMSLASNFEGRNDAKFKKIESNSLYKTEEFLEFE